MDEQIDILISRVVDGVATPGDWQSLEAQGAREPIVWFELAMAQRDHQLLTGAISAAVVRADRFELPVVEAPVSTVHDEHAHHFSMRARRAVMWGGWAAAAAIGMAFMLQQPTPTAPGNQTAGLQSPIATAADALSQYYKLGQKDGVVLGEVPKKVLINTEPAADGDGYDVIYLRQIMERTRVPDLYRLSSDEIGRPTSVPVQMTKARALPPM